MENSLSILLSGLIIDLISLIILKKLFRLKTGYFMLLALQIILIMPTILLLFSILNLFFFILIKLFVWFVVVLLITDSYYFKDVFMLWFWQVILMFSIYGITAFLTAFAKSLLQTVFGISISSALDFVVVLGLLVYFLAIFGFVNCFSKNKSLKSFLTKVSFSVLGKHIEITGLVDSGNSLYDTKTGKAVVVVSASAFKNILPRAEYLRLLSGDFSVLPITHQINFVSIDGKTSDLPVFDIGNISVGSKLKPKTFKCVIGITLHELGEGKNFECLLHKDFI